MRVLVTRPAREAQRWVREIQHHGITAVELPLIDIGPAPDHDAIRQAWLHLREFDAVMFVSGNAVERFFLLKPEAAPCWPAAGTRAWAPGPGTRDALLKAGVPGDSIDHPADEAGQFDSNTLWAEVGDQLNAGQRVLVVRGGDAAGQGAGRDWLATQLDERGVHVGTVVAYCRTAPQWSAAQAELAQEAASDSSVWLFSSSEAIAHLRALLPGQDWSGARAIATHPRIARSATDAGFGVVCLSRPTLGDVVASIESMR